MLTLIIADSRGRDLQNIMHKQSPDLNIKVLVHPGSGYELATLRSIPAIRAELPKLIIVLCGICDLTWKNKTTKRVGLRHSNSMDNVTHVLEALRSSHELLRAEGDFKISYATVTGLDLTDYNYVNRRHMTLEQYLDYCTHQKITHPDQRILDQSILAINKKIVVFNKSNRTKTAWIAGLVHSYLKKVYHHYYRRLYDGCHPDERTKSAWSDQLIKSIARITASPSPPKT